jgi:DNA repair photolyase
MSVFPDLWRNNRRSGTGLTEAYAMIISASRRTDIPACYADWFMMRVREGYFYRVNPFNSRQVSSFSLKPEDVDAVCFWTKNPRPLMRHLDELNARGLNYYFQFTLNPYDTVFEPNVPPLQERIDTMVELAGRIGRERVVWRYDPVILTSATPVPWHLEQAEQIAGKVSAATGRLVFSYYDFYGRGEGRLNRTLAGSGITLEDITAPEHAELLEQVARGFKEIAGRHSLQIFSCSERADLAAIGIRHGACVDGALVRELFGVAASAKKDKNQREACNCVESVDMGFYNSCPFHCAYCYANFNAGMIGRNIRRHYPDSPALLGRYEGEYVIRTSLNDRKR